MKRPKMIITADPDKFRKGFAMHLIYLEGKYDVEVKNPDEIMKNFKIEKIEHTYLEEVVPISDIDWEKIKKSLKYAQTN